MAHGIPDTNNFVESRTFLSQLDDTNAINVMPASNHAEIANLELENVFNFARLNVDTRGVVNPDERTRIADGTRVTCLDD